MGGYARNDSYIYSFSVITVGSLTNVRDDRVIKGGKGGAAICIGKLPPLPTTLHLLCHSDPALAGEESRKSITARLSYKPGHSKSLYTLARNLVYPAENHFIMHAYSDAALAQEKFLLSIRFYYSAIYI